MRNFFHILLFSLFIIHLSYGQCRGDINLDHTVDDEDISFVVNHILDIDLIEGDGFDNGDIDGNAVINIFDLNAVVDISIYTDSEWCDFPPIDLSLAWQLEEDLSYFDSDSLQNIVNNEIAALQYIRGFIVIHRGKILSEDYFNGSSIGQNYNIWSVTKSYISTLIGQAIDQGLISNQYVTLDSIFYQNSFTTLVTLEHVLTMTSGWPENGYYMYLENILDILLNTNLVWSPGSVWYYNNAACHINSYVLQWTTGMNPKAFAMENLFPQLGLGNPYWGVDADGVNNGSYDLYLTLRKMVKLGQLYLQDGYSADDQILSSEWVAAATSGQTNYWYEYLWWLPGIGYLAVGLGGQYIAVVPELDLVIGVHSATESSSFYQEQLLDIIYDQVVPLFDLNRSLNNYGINFEHITNAIK
jgi:CubicO group peptidase (beta-lactamase class C family)